MLGLASGGGFAQDEVRLPDIGGGTGRILPPEQERTFPRDFERMARAHGVLIEDPIVRDYFNQMGYRIVAHSTRAGDEFHFFVLAIPGINAFAAPAGVIGLNAGLILAATSEHEVAGVVAHEISHVTQNHLVRGMEEAQRVSVPLMLATLGIILAGGMSGGMSGDATQAILSSGLGLAQQAQINYTRQNEAEADRIGIGLMTRAGYDPLGMASFFQTLNSASRSMGQGPPEYLRTHPLTVSRVAEARERAERLEPRRLRSDDHFFYVQARLRVMMENQPENAALYFRTRLDRQDRPEAPMRYGLALSELRANRHDEADEQVQWLLRADPHNQLYLLLEADLLLARNQTREAIERLEKLHHAYGGSSLVAISLARALLHDEDPSSAALATEILRDQMRLNAGSIEISELLARAADRAGDAVRAAEAVAENYYLRGGLPQAIDQLERIMRRDDLDYYQRARISARLDEMRNERARLMGDRRPG